MTSDSCLHFSSCRSPPPVNFLNNELTNGPLEAFIKSRATLALISQAPSYISILTLVPAPAPIPTLTPEPTLALIPALVPDSVPTLVSTPTLIPALALAATSTTDPLFKQFMQAYLIVQTPDQDTDFCGRLFKVWFPKMYSENSYIEYYKFCQ